MEYAERIEITFKNGNTIFMVRKNGTITAMTAELS